MLNQNFPTQKKCRIASPQHTKSPNIPTPEPGTRETEHTSPASYANSSRGFVHKLKSGLRTQTQVGASYAMFMSGSDFIHPDDCEVLTAAQDSRLPPDMTHAVPPARARGDYHQHALYFSRPVEFRFMSALEWVARQQPILDDPGR